MRKVLAVVLVACLVSLGVCQDPYKVKGGWTTTGAISGEALLVKATTSAVFWASRREYLAGTSEVFFEKRDLNGVHQWARVFRNVGGAAGHASPVEFGFDFSNNVYLMFNRYRIVGATPVPEAVTVRLDGATGALVWEHVVPSALGTSLTSFGSATTALVYCGGKQINLGNPSLKSWYARKIMGSNGSNLASWGDPASTDSELMDITDKGLMTYRDGGSLYVRNVGLDPWTTWIGGANNWTGSRVDGSGLVATRNGNQGIRATFDGITGSMGSFRSFSAFSIHGRFEIGENEPVTLIRRYSQWQAEEMVLLWHDREGDQAEVVISDPFYELEAAEGCVVGVDFHAPARCLLNSSLVVYGSHFSSHPWSWQGVFNIQPRSSAADAMGNLWIVGHRLISGKQVAFLLKLATLPMPQDLTYTLDPGQAQAYPDSHIRGFSFAGVYSTVSYGTPSHGSFSRVGTQFTFTAPTNYGGVATLPYFLTREGVTRGGTIRFQIRPKLTGLVLTREEIVGGISLSGVAKLNGPVFDSSTTVGLTSSSTFAAVPEYVVINVGGDQASFPISTTKPTSDVNVTITAQRNSITVTANLLVRTEGVASLQIAPPSLIGGQSAIGTITLNYSAPVGGASVTLTQGGVLVVVPSSATVTAGASSTTFAIGTTPRAIAAVCNLTARRGSTYRTSSLLVGPGGLASVSTTVSTVRGGTPVSGRVATAGNTPAGGISVTLASNGNEVVVPPSLNVSQGTNQTPFTASTSTVGTSVTRTLTASWAGVVRTTTLTVTP